MDNANYLPLSNVSFTVTLPNPDLCVMTSWPVFDVRWAKGNRGDCKDYLQLQTLSSDRRATVWITCGTQFIPAALYNSSLLLRFYSEARTFWPYYYKGFQMAFFFHNKSVALATLPSGLFNCSDNNYEGFRQHLDCNMHVECENGEDEHGHCPSSSPLCEGAIDIQVCS
jgi:hypothetical protein